MPTESSELNESSELSESSEPFESSGSEWNNETDSDTEEDISKEKERKTAPNKLLKQREPRLHKLLKQHETGSDKLPKRPRRKVTTKQYVKRQPLTTHAQKLKHQQNLRCKAAQKTKIRQGKLLFDDFYLTILLKLHLSALCVVYQIPKQRFDRGLRILEAKMSENVNASEYIR